MRIVRVPMEVGTPGASYSLRLTLPSHARVVAIGLEVSPRAALTDHEVLSFKHGGLQRVTKSTVGVTEYGVMLGHVACSGDFEVGDLGRLAPTRFQPWPGRFNWDRDWQWLQQKVREGVALTRNELLRLHFAASVPAERFTILPLKPNYEVKIDLARVTGSTSVTHADLVCVEFDENLAKDVQAFDTICGMADLTDYPHWLSQALILPAAAAEQDASVQRRWKETEIAPHALRIIAPFYSAHSNNGAGVITHAPGYLNQVLLNFKSDQGGRIWPSYADERRRLGHQCVELLQHFDELRRFDRTLAWDASLHIETQTLLTAQQKDLRGGFYGVLRPQTLAGEVQDAA